MDIPIEDPTIIRSKIVFISRADTYFGRILAQHFAHASVVPRNQDSEEFSKKLLDLSFLDDETKTGYFKVFGTFRPEHSLNPYEPSKRPTKIPGAMGLCPADSSAHLRKLISAADICVFHSADHDGANELLDDTVRALDVAGKVLSSQGEKSPKVMVLVSTAMTWARTKEHPGGFPVPEDKGKGYSTKAEIVDHTGFCEDEFRRRKPHPNFRPHLELERRFQKLASMSDGLITAIVVAAGVVYGYGEHFLQWMFKEAWLNSRAVPVLGAGTVRVPTIHARDLCQIVQAAALNPPRNRYLIAVDDGQATLQQIAEAISQTLSDGTTEHRDPDEALMLRAITPVQYDIFTTDLVLEATTVRDVMKFNWVSQPGFLAAMPRLVEEYKIRRNLYPLKLAVFGAPYSGKTTLARRLCDDYNLHYVDVTDLVQKGVTELQNVVKHGEDVVKEAEASQLLEGIQASKVANGGRIADQFALRFARDFLHSIPCQNQGFVLDGYPESYAAAKDLFAQRAHPGNLHREDDGKQQQDQTLQRAVLDRSIVPDHVIFLDAPDEYLKQRILSHCPSPKKEPPIEVSVVQKFAEYNFLSNEEDNVLTYFEEAEIPIQYIDITQDKDAKMERTLHTAMKRVGRAHNYFLSREDKLDLLRQEAERRVLQGDEEAKQEAFYDQLQKRDRDRRCCQWRAELEKIFEDEKQPKKRPHIPMRQYLMTHIFPAVIDGLAACVAARPADPIDFLAEYLLQHSRPLYLDEKVPFTKMTAPFLRKRKKDLDAAEQKRKMEAEFAVRSTAGTGTDASTELPT